MDGVRSSAQELNAGAEERYLLPNINIIAQSEIIIPLLLYPPR